jgi:integrase
MGKPAGPSTVNSPVRRYLTEREVERLMTAARKGSRWGHRDATMILIGYRHGLRACELCDLEWHQVELTTRAVCTSVGPRTVRRACIRYEVTNYAPCGVYSASRVHRLTCSSPNAAAR